MRMKKAFKTIIYILLPIVLIVGGFFYVKDVFLTPKPLETYSFSGYVYGDGNPLADVTITCDEGTTTTDNNGYYIFSNVTDVVSVSADKDGYLIADNLKFASKNNAKIDFDAYKYYDKYGVVENKGNTIANATIKVISKAGEFTTTTNSRGEFYLPKLAGEATVEVVSETTQFFNQTFDITNTNLTISGTTSISGAISVNDNANKDDFILKLNNTQIIINDDLTFDAEGVSCGDIITLTSEKFHIYNSQITINEESQQLSFVAEKYYDVQIAVVSGGQYLSNTQIYVNGELDCLSNEGICTILNLFGENEITFVNKDFKFQNIVIYDSCLLNVIGYVDIVGSIVSDDNIKTLNIIHNGKEYCAENGTFKIENCQLGDELDFISDGYYLNNNKIIVSSSENIIIEKEKLYSLNLSIFDNELPVDCATIIDGHEYFSLDGYLTIDDMHGEKLINITANGYVFETYNCDYCNNDIVVNPYKIFSVVGVVKSGDLILTNAVILWCGEEINVNENGEFEIANLYKPSTLVVSCDGYITQEINYDCNNNIFNINMLYNIDGYVLCGKVGVSGVIVSDGKITATSNKDGYFVINNLFGEVDLTFTKSYYNFDTYKVSSTETIEVITTFDICGSVSTGEGFLSNFKVILISLENNEKIVGYTSDIGEYSFEGLSGEYLLIYDENIDIVLKPSFYEINIGGVYDFADKGYSLGGVVTSGGIPVADVVVRAGDNITTTNANGEYEFALLTKPCVLTLSKDGYTFENNNLQVDDSYDLNKNVSFSCSYMVRGIVRSGNILLDNAQVSVGDKMVYTVDGAFEILGITGNSEINIQLYGYNFGESIAICEYDNFDFNGSYSTILRIKSGSLRVCDAKVLFGEQVINSDANGEVALPYVYGGNEYSISKDGYNFSTYAFGEYLEINEIDVSYNVTGIILNAGVGISGATISIADRIITTDIYGKFVIDNIYGEHILIISKESYEFNEVSISNPEYLEITAMFKVTGYVLLDSLPISGVNVTIGDKQTTTNTNGYFEISRIDSAGNIHFEKIGYDFGDSVFVNTNKSLTIFATYSLSGVVVSGNIKISGARVISSNGIECVTDNLGNYTLHGLDRVVSIAVVADGYDDNIMDNISGYANNLNFNLTYSLVIKFNGEYSNVRIGVNNAFKEYSSQVVILENLSGENYISYSKLGYTFVEDNTGSVICYEERNVNIVLVYTVSGRITTSSGFVVPNATVSAGGKKAITNSNGEYVLEGLSNKLTVRVSLESEDVLFEIDSPKQVAYDTTCNLTFSDEQYFYYLTILGYENLRNSYAYLVVADGVISPNTSLAGKQSTRVIYRKDGSGKRLSQNLNYGEEIKILGMGVDPRVAFLSYYDPVAGKIMYKRAEGENIKSDKTADYSKYNWSTEVTDKNTYLNTFGTNIEGFYPYAILLNSSDKKKISGEYGGDTVSSITSISQSGNNFTYTINLNTGLNDTIAYYKKQMKYMVPEQDCKGFSKIQLKYTVTTSGILKDLIIEESYSVESYGQVVSTDATFDYSFNMYAEGDGAIVNIDDSVNGIINALSIDGVSLMSSKENEIIIYKRREEL